MPKDWDIDLPGGRSKGDEDIVVDTTSLDPLRIAAADEPEEVDALNEKLARAKRGTSAPPGRDEPEIDPAPEQEFTG
ncbi:MAG TPA: hypothetical protein VNJ04_10765 [Gemmatimonadaceae bacterium]|nr:hypothetical protein [Gemmatimonadaceae bacterium]